MSTDGRYAAGAGMRRSGDVHGRAVCRGRRDAQERRCPYIGVKYIGVRRRSAFKLRLKPRKDRKAIVKIQISCQLMFLLSRLPSVRECAPTFGLRTTLCCGRGRPAGTTPKWDLNLAPDYVLAFAASLCEGMRSLYLSMNICLANRCSGEFGESDSLLDTLMS